MMNDGIHLRLLLEPMITLPAQTLVMESVSSVSMPTNGSYLL